jgi:rRNA-processing protein FCF1
MDKQSVIVDTNMLITCIKNKVNIFEILEQKGLKITIPDQVIQELENIHESKKPIKQRTYAHLTLQILEKRTFSTIDLKTTNVDKGILDFAKANPKITVATLDRNLRERLKKSNIRLMTLRSEMLEFS